MTLSTIVNGRCWVGAYDISGNVNKMEFDPTAEYETTTNMNSANFAEGMVGLKTAPWRAEGFYEGATVDAATTALLGTTVVTSMAVDSTAGSVAYFGSGPILAAKPGFTIGKVAAIEAGGVASPIIRGAILYPKTTLAATANGAALNHGAVSATQAAYGALHVFSASSGDTLDVKIQSDDNSGFTTPTDRITFTQVSGATIGSELKSLAGAITDTYWRIVATIAGNGSESFSFGVTFGIQ